MIPIANKLISDGNELEPFVDDNGDLCIPQVNVATYYIKIKKELILEMLSLIDPSEILKILKEGLEQKGITYGIPKENNEEN